MNIKIKVVQKAVIEVLLVISIIFFVLVRFSGFRGQQYPSFS